MRSLLALILAMASVAPLAAQEAEPSEMEALRQEIEAMRRGQQAIQRELQQIKSLLRQQQSGREPAARRRPSSEVPPGTVIDLAGRPLKGTPESQLAVIELLDYQ